MNASMIFQLLLVTVLFQGPGDKQVEVTCPVDGTKFKAWVIKPYAALGGLDRDFCMHPGLHPRLHLMVWTCPGCYFTGRRQDFDRRFTGKEKEKLLGHLKPIERIDRDTDQNKLPGEVKYDLLAQTRRLLGAPLHEIGQAYLHAAWSVRQRGPPDLSDFVEVEEIRRQYGLDDFKRYLSRNRSEADMRTAERIVKDVDQGKFKKDGAKELLALYVALAIYRRHGEHGRTAALLERLEKRKDENSVVADALVKIRKGMEEEKKWQRKALEAYRRAYEEVETEEDKFKLEYILGELCRRLGEPGEALKWYERALDREEALKEQGFKQVLKWAREQKALVED